MSRPQAGSGAAHRGRQNRHGGCSEPSRSVSPPRTAPRVSPRSNRVPVTVTARAGRPSGSKWDLTAVWMLGRSFDGPMKITVDGELNDANVDRLVSLLEEGADAPTLDFDFSQVGFVYPHATLVAAAAIVHTRDQRRARGLPTRYIKEGLTQGTPTAAASYLGHVGFFQFLGIPFGNAPGEAPGSSTYLPITRLSRDGLSADDGEAAVYRAVEQESYRLAHLVWSDDTAIELLAYCFRETIRNVFEHAMTDSCALMAQKYMGTDVELAVVDFGRGIHASLSEVFPGISPEAALREALKPGITRSVRDEGRGKWENTGYGLFVLSELGRQGGSFSIWSGPHRLTAGATEELTSVAAAHLAGTAIQLRVRTTDAEHFPNHLADIVRRGESAKVPGAVSKKGSSKSRLTGWT